MRENSTKTFFFFTEINFWNNRLKNLTYIYEQLRNEKIKSMALILEVKNNFNHTEFLFKTLGFEPKFLST